MGGINLNKKLWRMPQKGMVRGVCAGIADYLDVPVKLVRILVVLSIFFGLAFFTVVAISFCLLYWTLCRIIWPQANRSDQRRTAGYRRQRACRRRKAFARNGTLRHVRYVHTA